MAVAFVVLVRDPSNQTFSWLPVIAGVAEQAMGLAAQHLEATGRANTMLVGAFTRDQVLSAEPLFAQMEEVIKKNG
jgi:hypothetical protein